jgi:hypothetical protein
MIVKFTDPSGRNSRTVCPCSSEGCDWVSMLVCSGGGGLSASVGGLVITYVGDYNGDGLDDAGAVESARA